MGKLLHYSSALLVLLIMAADARSAAPPRPGLRLETVLREWARANDAIRSARYRFTRTEHDLAFDTRTVTKGEVQLLKPDLLRVDLGFPGERGILLFTKKKIHFFNPAAKTELVYPKPTDRSFHGEKTPERSFLTSLKALQTEVLWQEAFQQQVFWYVAGFVGLPVRDLPQRFDVRLTREDTWYAYLDIQSRRPKDKSYCERRRVVIRKDNFRVRQIWCELPNGNTRTLDFYKFDTKAKITPESIRKGLSEGWNRVELVGSPKDAQKD
jgi:hypothetical protein